MKTIKPFDPQSEYVQIHNYVFDAIMPALKPNSFKVLMFIVRKTKGWGKDTDSISYSQIREGTGIKSDATLAAAISELRDLMYITVVNEGKWSANEYTLNTTLEFEVEPPITSKTVVAPTSKTVVAPTSKTVVAPTSKTVDTKETLKENKKESGSSGSGSDRNRKDDTAYAEICTAVETNGFGMLTPFTAVEIQSLMDEYPQDWILDAMKISVSQNKRKLSYAAGILRRWRADGRDERKPEERAASWQKFNQDVPDYMQEMLSQ